MRSALHALRQARLFKPNWVSQGEITLGAGQTVEFLDDLPAAVAAITSDVVAAPPAEAWRHDALTSSPYMADYLQPASLIELTPSARLRHFVSGSQYVGMPGPMLRRQFKDSADYIENITGVRPTTFSWPNHYNTRQAQGMARNHGYVAVRCGHPTNTEPNGSWLHGAATEVDWVRSWSKFTPFALPTPSHTGANSIKDVLEYTDEGTPGQTMDDLLNDTTTWNAAHAPYAMRLYGGQTNLIAMWKHYHTWVQVYGHGYGAEMSAAQYDALLDVLIAADLWVSDLKTIGDYAHARHEQSSTDDLIYEPTTGNEAADGSGTPWNGKAAAFTVTLDADRDEVLNIADTFDALGKRLTVVVCPFTAQHNTDSWEFLEADISTLYAKGNVDVGCHGYAGVSIVGDVGAVLNSAAGDRWAAEVQDGSPRKLVLYKHVSTVAADWWAEMAALGDHYGLVDADDLASGALSSLTETGTDAAGLAEGTGNPTVGSGPNGHQAISFSGAQRLVFDAQSIDYTNGLTVAVVWQDGVGTNTNKAICAVRDSTPREWMFSNVWGWIYGDVTSNAVTGLGADTDWHVGIMTLVPGSQPRQYVDSVASAYGTASQTVASLSDAAADFSLGGYADGGSMVDGDLAFVIRLNQGFAHGADGLATLMDTLKTRFGIS